MDYFLLGVVLCSLTIRGWIVFIVVSDILFKLVVITNALVVLVQSAAIAHLVGLGVLFTALCVSEKSAV